MSNTIEQRSDFTFTIPSGDAVEHVVEDVKTIRASVLKVWPSRPTDPARSQWMKLVETTNAYSFWNHPAEDIYTDNDGEPA